MGIMISVVGRNNLKREIAKPSTIKDIREELDLDSEQYLSLKNGNPATDDEKVELDDEVVFLEVFSGG